MENRKFTQNMGPNEGFNIFDCTSLNSTNYLLKNEPKYYVFKGFNLHSYSLEKIYPPTDYKGMR